ncbi:DNA-binding transcriptional MerR regulator [Clostridium acetobutylicum]|uniref:Transcriptional regulator, MerR family (Duplicated domains) n=2 Tax=Clostridium acetobutylicum TaxID=1488 RepID=Q97DG8_CLOAB|nr:MULTISPECIES: MerR family transcriptional regulator [Clostridium]AAK81435.1 Transcriptional regulator, MerR family (duplicated domains) [Clostridium acetobutylicum ATCC 824]ADZ22550.1 Transcriptional regulator, MerR family (duplicated domains) [Clostridium acetobutylicum EA 2018]AEI33688.1 transcriptional regulator [Clostridium acetobutylicum DSM 1731]AWV80894.1 MerR family transcriptional regulator [Clostridium acetobutylicum]MBC2393780.1 MerR family transcriptional regulator [Clostridium 
MKSYRPIELAKMFNLHSNTIRFYESIGYISKASRKPNGYREFTDKHILQLTICRHILGYRYTNRHIRDTGKLIIICSAESKLIEGKQYAQDYIKIIQNEIEIAEKTAQLLHKWAELKRDTDNSDSIEKFYTRNEVACLLGVTSEAVRNWERNDLIKSDKRGYRNAVLFNNIDLDRIRIIYMLRQTGYSMSAIHRCLMVYDKGQTELVVAALNKTDERELLSVGDCWLSELKKLESAAEEIPLIFDKLKES